MLRIRNIPLVLLAGLVRIQCGSVLMEANQGKFKALTPLDGIRDRRTTNEQPAVLHAGKVLQLLQFSDEGSLVFVRDVGTKPKIH